jgi:lipid-A-disaccharide synthase
MAVILPFEETFYRQHGVPVTFVGHPLMDHHHAPHDRRDCTTGEKGVTIGLLPGSRDSEIEKLLPRMLSAAKLIGQRVNVRFLLSQAPSVSPSLMHRLTKEWGFAGEIVNGKTDTLLKQATLVIVASGTTTLEAAIHQTPMIIVYRVSPLSYQLGRALIKVPHIGLVNLIAGKRVAPELIQHDASPGQIARQVLGLLADPEKLNQMKDGLAEVTRRLGKPGASDAVAEIAWGLLGRPDPYPRVTCE